MSSTDQRNKIVGETKTVLVCPATKKPVAFITSLKATWSPEPDGQRIRFVGPLEFHSKTQRHIRDCILPIMDDICDGLQIAKGSFQISGSNLGAASVRDAGLDVSGYSADVPVFLCLLSARLNLPLPQEVVSTGHIASSVGHISLVHNMELKLRAALESEAIQTFIHPGFHQDASVVTLLKDEVQSLQKAMVSVKGQLNVAAVDHVVSLVKLIWSERDCLLSVMRMEKDFQCISIPEGDDASSCIVRLLIDRLESRFFKTIKEGLQCGQPDLRLLNTWVDAHVRWKRYPDKIGQKIQRILKSIPPHVLGLRLRRPFLSVKRCMNLTLIAAERDFSDAFLLYESVHGAGKKIRRGSGFGRKKGAKTESNVLRLVMADISASHLTRTIGLPIDEARSSFVLDSVIVRDAAELEDVICAFYVHLRTGTNEARQEQGSMMEQVEAGRILEEAFQQDGGYDAVLAEAQTGIQGGLRMILDRLTDYYKRRTKESYVNYILKMALDAFDWQGKGTFMKLFFEQCPDAIPEELRGEDPSRYARHWKLIIQNYVHALDNMQKLMQTL